MPNWFQNIADLEEHFEEILHVFQQKKLSYRHLTSMLVLTTIYKIIFFLSCNSHTLLSLEAIISCRVPLTSVLFTLTARMGSLFVNSHSSILHLEFFICAYYIFHLFHFV